MSRATRVANRDGSRRSSEGQRSRSRGCRRRPSPGIARDLIATAAPRMRSTNWQLIVQFALKDFKIRYTHSVLGYAWSVLNPLVFAVIYYLVFSVFIRFDVPNYPGFLLLGIVLWNFFSEGSSNGLGALLARGGIVTKVAMPRHVVVFAAILNALLTFAITLVILALLLWFTGTRLGRARRRLPGAARRPRADHVRHRAPPRAAPRALPRRRLSLGHRGPGRLLAHPDHLPGGDDPGALALAHDLQPAGAHHSLQPPGPHLRGLAGSRSGC